MIFRRYHWSSSQKSVKFCQVQYLSEFEYVHRQVIGCVVVISNTHEVKQDESIESLDSSVGGSTELSFPTTTTALEASDSINSIAKWNEGTPILSNSNIQAEGITEKVAKLLQIGKEPFAGIDYANFSVQKVAHEKSTRLRTWFVPSLFCVSPR